MSEMNKNPDSKCRKPKRIAIPAIVLGIILLLGVLGSYAAVQVLDQVERAKTLKASVETLVGCVSEQDTAGAQSALDVIKQTSSDVRNSLDTPLWKIASKVPMLKEEFQSVRSLLDILDDATQTVLQPGISLLNEHPLESIASSDASAVQSYSDFIQTALPKAKELFSTASNLNLGMLNPEGKVSDLLDGVNDLVATANRFSSEIIPSVTELLKEYPLDQIKQDNNYNVVYLNKYLDFAESMLPQVREAIQDVEKSSLAGSKQIKSYLKTAKKLIKLYDKNPDLIQLIRNFLGSGEEKHYLLAALNSSEIRAVGGFPGAMGTVSIKDGIMTVDDFRSVYDVLASHTTSHMDISNEERLIFRGGQNGLELSWDACLNPDFPRVCEIWSLSYAERNGVELDGIIALTPTVIQKILNINGAAIKLSDGTKLKSSNATHQLQYDLYFKYYTKTSSPANVDDQVNQLFAETANKTLTSIFKRMTVDRLAKYVDMLDECFAERNTMMWMRDRSSQKIIQKRGWDGALNSDPNNPQAGIYFNCAIASKMGWFVEIKSEIGEPVTNDDTTVTYPITVKVSNIVTQEEINTAHAYIIGHNAGNLGANMHFFAPAGGTISNFHISPKGGDVSLSTYRGLPLVFLNYWTIAPGQEYTITYNVTTAPGVTTPLTLSQTPTLTEFH